MKGQPTPNPNDIIEGMNSKKAKEGERWLTGVLGEGIIIGFKGNKVIAYYNGAQYAVLKEKLVSVGPGRWKIPSKPSRK